MSKKHGKGRRLDKRGFKLKLKRETTFSIVQLFFFALAALVLISFSRQGAILLKFNDLLITYFSWSSIFLPFIFLAFAFLVSKTKFVLGQPNVIVGGLLLFISIMSMGKAGTIGLNAWDGISALVTGIGAGIILVGTSLVGIIVLFNTSIQQVFKVISEMLKNMGIYVYGQKPMVIGGTSSTKPTLNSPSFQMPNANKTSNVPNNSELPREPLEQKLVSNIPGE